MNRRLVLLGLVLWACEAPPPPFVPPPPAYEQPIGPEPAPYTQYHVGEVRNGDAVSTAFLRAGLSLGEVNEVVAAFGGLFDVRYARPGQWFELKRDQDARLTWFQYHADPTKTLIAFLGSDGALHGLREPIAVKTTTTSVAGVVQGSLYEAMEAQGESPWLTLTLVDIFSWDVDFYTEPQEGDRFRIIVEKRYVEDQFVGYGNVLAAEYAFATGTRRHRAFRYAFADGKIGYYTEDGQAVEKTFLKSPIQFASITSRYGMRRHPILKFVRAHKGVDYGAPMGTAVWSIGDGVVHTAGVSGGYGKLVAIRHRNGLESRYGHLRDYGAGIRAGVRVSQKQVIGYVGKTGLATGPHLHFEVLRNGQHTNPLTVAAPPAPPIPEEERPRFFAWVSPWRQRLDEPLATADKATP